MVSKQHEEEYRLPHVSAFVICTRAVEDRISGMVSLFDLIDEVTAPSFPAGLPQIAIYIKLADGVGRYTCRVRCLYFDEQVSADPLNRLIVGQDEQTIQFSDHQRMNQGVFYITPIHFHKPGRYEFWLQIDGKYVDHRGLDVKYIGEA